MNFIYAVCIFVDINAICFCKKIDEILLHFLKVFILKNCYLLYIAVNQILHEATSKQKYVVILAHFTGILLNKIIHFNFI